MNSKFVERAEQLSKETEEWRKTWKHRKPCKDWVEHERSHGMGFCKHLVRARRRKFEDKILKLFDLNEYFK